MVKLYPQINIRTRPRKLAFADSKYIFIKPTRQMLANETLSNPNAIFLNVHFRGLGNFCILVNYHCSEVSFCLSNLRCALMTTVNSRYCRHSHDSEFVSSIKRVRNNRRLFQSSVYEKNSVGDFAAVRISGVSIIARCPQGES